MCGRRRDRYKHVERGAAVIRARRAKTSANRGIGTRTLACGHGVELARGCGTAFERRLDRRAFWMEVTQ
jgi:hypothetical protein